MKYLKKFNEGSKYLGSCVDVGSDSRNRKPICDYFPDATTMAYVVGNPDEEDLGQSSVIDKDTFYKYVDKSIIKNKMVVGDDVRYYYVSEDRYGDVIKIEEASFFFIYNASTDIHYFFVHL
jgi:hypothetical protein